METREFTDEELRKIANRASGSAKPEDLRWIIPALVKFRDRWTGKPAEAARTTKVPRGTIGRWLYEPTFPGRKSLKMFKRACELSGIEV